jgi:hypothetical protein
MLHLANFTALGFLPVVAVPTFPLLQMLAIFDIGLLTNILTDKVLVCKRNWSNRRCKASQFQSRLAEWHDKLDPDRAFEIPSTWYDVWNIRNISWTMPLLKQHASFG